MNRFIFKRGVLLAALSILFVNVVFSQIKAINITSTGELLNLTLKTNNGLIVVGGDFRGTRRQEGNHRVNYRDGRIRNIDNYYFDYEYDGKIRNIGNEYFRHSNNTYSYGKFREIAGITLTYHNSGRDRGKLERINNQYLYYTNGILNNAPYFIERGIAFRIFNRGGEFYGTNPNYYSPGPIYCPPGGIPNGYTFVNPSITTSESLALAMLRTGSSSSYSRVSNYHRVKKERPVFKFIGDKCFKIIKDGASLSATPVECKSYKGNYKRVRDEVFVLRYDEKVCFKGELVDGEYLIFESRKCPKGKERSRLIYH